MPHEPGSTLTVPIGCKIDLQVCSRLGADVYIVLMALFCHEDVVELRPTREASPIYLTSMQDGMIAETTMVSAPRVAHPTV